MGSKYKKKLEMEYEDKCCSDLKLKTLQLQADKDITGLMRKKLVVRKRRYK